MKPPIGIASALLAAALSAGCIHFEETISLGKEGDGRIDIRYSVAEQTLPQFKAIAKLNEEMSKVAGQPVATPTDLRLMDIFLFKGEDEIRQEIERYRKYGLTLDMIKVDSRGGRRYFTLRVLFKDIAKLAETDLFRQYGFDLTRDKDGNYVIFRPAPSAGEPSGPRHLDPDTEKMVAPILTGFYVDLQFNAPSRIVRANATSKAIYTAEWSFDYDKDPNAYLALQNEPLSVTFESRGVTLPEIKLPPPVREPAPRPPSASPPIAPANVSTNR